MAKKKNTTITAKLAFKSIRSGKIIMQIVPEPNRVIDARLVRPLELELLAYILPEGFDLTKDTVAGEMNIDVGVVKR